MINGKITGEIKSILDILKINPTITIPRLAELTGKSRRFISRELREHQDSGLL
jgi:DeoR/GlpR family transcriptional regulator of sugar metabolism